MNKRNDCKFGYMCSLQHDTLAWLTMKGFGPRERSDRSRSRSAGRDPHAELRKRLYDRDKSNFVRERWSHSWKNQDCLNNLDGKYEEQPESGSTASERVVIKSGRRVVADEATRDDSKAEESEPSWRNR